MSSRFCCWLCPLRLSTKKELKSHLSSKHRRLEVICPFCPDRRFLRRFWDLKNHVNHTHPSQAKTLDDNFWKERNGFWFAVHPKDHARIIEPPPVSSNVAIKAKGFMKKWLLSSRSKERLQDWERDWRKFGGLARETQSDASLEDVQVYVLDENEVAPSSSVPKSSHHPENPVLDYDFEVVSVNLQPRIEAWIKAGGHLYYRVNFQQNMLQDCHAIQALTRKAPSGDKFQQYPTGNGLSVPITTAGPLVQFLGTDAKYLQQIRKWTVPLFGADLVTPQAKTNSEINMRGLSPISEMGDVQSPSTYLQLSPTANSPPITVSTFSQVPVLTNHQLIVDTTPGMVCSPQCLNAATPHLPESRKLLSPQPFPTLPGFNRHLPSLPLSAQQSPQSRVTSPTNIVPTERRVTFNNHFVPQPPPVNEPTNSAKVSTTISSPSYAINPTAGPSTTASSSSAQHPTGEPSNNPPMLQFLENNGQDEVLNLSISPNPLSTSKPPNPQMDLTLQVTQAPKPSEGQSASTRACKLLRRGCMPLMPPARRDWTKGRSVGLTSGHTNISWPPHGWDKMTPENKELHWMHLATTFEMAVNGCLPSDHTDLRDRYNMFALPGMSVVKTKKAYLPSGVSQKSRLCNYKLVAAIALGKQISVSERNQDRLMDMLESAAACRDKSTDEFSDLLDAAAIPLQLEP